MYFHMHTYIHTHSVYVTVIIREDVNLQVRALWKELGEENLEMLEEGKGRGK